MADKRKKLPPMTNKSNARNIEELRDWFKNVSVVEPDESNEAAGATPAQTPEETQPKKIAYSIITVKKDGAVSIENLDSPADKEKDKPDERPDPLGSSQTDATAQPNSTRPKTTAQTARQKWKQPRTIPIKPDHAPPSKTPAEDPPLVTRLTSKSPPRIYNKMELYHMWSHMPPMLENREPPSVLLERMQLDNKLDNVLCKLREETEPVDETRHPSRNDYRRMILDFTDVFTVMEKHVKADPECKRIFYTMFQDDYKMLLSKYINIFTIPTDVSFD